MSKTRLELLLWKRCKFDSLFLARLTNLEYKRFEEAKISFSGSTGMCDPKLYRGGLAPYIASFLFNIEKAKKVLRWKHPPHLRLSGSNWIMTKHKSRSGGRRDQKGGGK